MRTAAVAAVAAIAVILRAFRVYVVYRVVSTPAAALSSPHRSAVHTPLARKGYPPNSSFPSFPTAQITNPRAAHYLHALDWMYTSKRNE